MRKIVIPIVIMMSIAQAFGADTLSLAGKWRVRLDPKDTGIAKTWQNQRFQNKIYLPSSLPEQGYGDNPQVNSPWTGTIKQKEWNKPQYAPYKTADNFKMPFWLQPNKIYVGAAWYQKEIKTPASWLNKHIVLHLERAHWQTRIWVDGKFAGVRDSLSTPHEYDLTHLIKPGTKQILTIRVDNRMIVNVGINAHSVTDHTQTNWNGIVGKINLTATDKLWVDDVQVYPNVEKHMVHVKVTIGNATGNKMGGKMIFRVIDPKENRLKPVSLMYHSDHPLKTFETDINLGNRVQLWDEFTPNLYTLIVTLNNGESRTVTFGMRNLTTSGTQFVLNGRKMMFRGTLNCAAFPLTGYPPTTQDYWYKIIRTCKAYGLNHMRFHSWCPPEAAFIVADKLGFYFQIECAAWTTIGNGKPIDTWLYREGRRITRAYGNHPSFMLMAYGNEPGGKNHARYLAKWCTYWKKRDPRHLYTSASGWPILKETNYNVTPKPRIQRWGEGLRSIINAQPPNTLFDWSNFVSKHPDKPTISHEIGQWCAYPDFNEIKKCTGVLKACNFEIFRNFLNAKHMGYQAHDFLMASGKLQLLCYKADIEAALRTRGFGGFQLLGLQDFPGQGTALVGVLDPFWDAKDYVSPKIYTRFCNRTVPLARLTKRTFTNQETLTFALDVAHYGPVDFKNATVWWKLHTSDGQTIDSGQWQEVNIPTGNLYHIGTQSITLKTCRKAQRLRLEAGIKGTNFTNHWDVWVYPKSVNTTPPASIMITNTLNRSAITKLQQGGSVLLMVPPSQVKTSVKLGFSSIFWNTAWTGGQPPHTLGILCNPKHPALAKFPTSFHSNWQWWDLITKAATMELDKLPANLHPIVQVVPDWFNPKKLALVFEANVENGKLLVCSIDLNSNLNSRPVARQLRYSLLTYMAGNKFHPTVNLSPEQIKSLLKPLSFLQKIKATIRADSQETDNKAVFAIDNNPATLWHTQWRTKAPPYPHELILDLKQPLTIIGVRLLPRQDGISNGRVKNIEIKLSLNARDKGKIVAKTSLPNNSKWQEIRFAKPATGRYLRLIFLKPQIPSQPWASMAEVQLIMPGVRNF